MSALIRFCYGELCPSKSETVHARCQNGWNGAVKTGVSGRPVMSRSCPHRRFHEKADITSTCWLWTGSSSEDRFGNRTYGQFYLDGRRMGAHVASYLLHVGSAPAGLDVMHSCDVKACVNPAHLSPGTRSQNLIDGFAANPGVCAGENNGRARLDWPRVRAIRAAAASVPQAELAAQYGVTQSHISQIVRGLKWPEPTQAEAVA